MRSAAAVLWTRTTLMQDEGVKEQMEGEYVLLGEINPDNPDEGPH